LIYEVIGLLGYLTFGKGVGSNIIENYPRSTLVSVCQFAIVVLVLFSYPLQLHPCRASLDKVLQTGRRDEDFLEGAESDDIPLPKFIAMSSCILFGTFVIAIEVRNLETILGLVGATGSTTISFILPSLFFLSLYRNSVDRYNRMCLFAATILLLWGFFVMTTALGLQIYQSFRPAA